MHWYSGQPASPPARHGGSMGLKHAVICPAHEATFEMVSAHAHSSSSPPDPTTPCWARVQTRGKQVHRVTVSSRSARAEAEAAASLRSHKQPQTYAPPLRQGRPCQPVWEAKTRVGSRLSIPCKPCRGRSALCRGKHGLSRKKQLQDDRPGRSATGLHCAASGYVELLLQGAPC